MNLIKLLVGIAMTVLACLLCGVVMLNLSVSMVAAQLPFGREEVRAWQLGTPQAATELIDFDGLTPIPPGSAPVGATAPGFPSMPNNCQAVTAQGAGDRTFVWPVGWHHRSGYWFTSSSSEINSDGTLHYHPGVDLALRMGDPVYAAQAGTIFVMYSSAEGYGQRIMIDHGNGDVSLYAHLSAFNVVCGQWVAQGEVIGLGGSTGNSTGAHLHFEIGRAGRRINPCDVLPDAASTNCDAPPQP